MRCPSLALGLALFTSFASACTGSEGGSESDETGSASSATTGEAPPPGPGAEGWQSAYADGGVAFACDADEQSLIDAGVPALSFGEASIYVGYEQDGNNQNPLFARYDGGAQLYCQRHEGEPPDARALGLSWDGGDYAYVTYTVDGGGSSLEGKGGWLSSYAPGSISGGGPKVSVVGRVTTSDGTPVRARISRAAIEIGRPVALSIPVFRNRMRRAPARTSDMATSRM